MMYVGIDPGFTGAMACYCNRLDEWRVLDMPVVHIATKNKTPKGNIKYRTEINLKALSHWFEQLTTYNPMISVTIEKSQAMGASKNGRAQGLQSTARYMEAYGIVVGHLAALAVPFTPVSSVRWKRDMAVPADKKLALRLARTLVAPLGPRLTRVKDHGRAEAALLCLYGIKNDPFHIDR